MGQDRLAALRAQRQTDVNHSAIEMQGLQSSYSSPHAAGVNGSSYTQDTSTMSGFYAEISSIQESISQFDANVNVITDLHARSLNALSEAETASNTARLAELTESTRALSNGLAKRVKALQKSVKGISKQDAEIRKNRTTLVHGKFVETLRRYQSVEQQYRQRFRDRVERQFKIVKPDASPEEVSAVVNDTQGGGSGIFLQAISSSNRYGESRQAYREVQERHQDIQRIENTLAELAQLFNDMATLVDQQKEQIDDIEAKAGEVELDTRKGVGEVDVAVKHARSARRKRWICFWLTVIIILAAVGIGVGVYFSQHPPNSSSSSSSSGNSTTSG